MQRSIYLRPVGMYAAPPSEEGGEVRGGMPLAGSRLAFSAIEVIERNGRSATRRIVGLGEFMERDWGRSTLAGADLLEVLREPRQRFAGLTFDRPRIMGIVNVTPDSFSDGGRHATTKAAIEHGLRLVDEGADILDIGGESTRPGSDAVPLEDELARVMPVIEGLRAKTRAVISVDTRKAEVMRRAAAAGADVLNDVSALSHDPHALAVAAESGLPVVLMHAQGDPKTMQDKPQYDDVLLDVFDYLAARIAVCVSAGIPKSRLVVDPGIGFGKLLHHNLAVMAKLSIYHGLGVPILLGASRKRTIGQLSNVPNAEDRVHGSIAAALAGIAQGVQIVRVHDVAETRQALSVWQAVTTGVA
ncbi:MAG: dihydropteroate synthase [Hyphomicrobiaceae bacterium]